MRSIDDGHGGWAHPDSDAVGVSPGEGDVRRHVAGATPSLRSDQGAVAGPMGYLRHLVVRVGGLPIERLDELAAPDTWSAAESVLQRTEALVEQARAESDRLYELIPKVPAKRVRKKLLRLRRDVFKLRVPRPSDIERVADASLRADLEDLRADILELETLRTEFSVAFDRDRKQASEALRKLASDPDLRAGIRLSSPLLARRLEAVRKDPEHDLDVKAEAALARYVTRTAAKATPFGRFCAVIPGTFAAADGGLELRGDPGHKWSRIRSNKQLMQVAIAWLVADTPARRQLPVRVNPTVGQDESRLRFLASMGTGEAFQHLSRNAAVDVVFRSLTRVAGLNGQRNGTPQSVRTLAAAVAALDEVEATPDVAEGFVDELLKLGLLQLDLPGLGHDPEWPGTLRAFLEAIDGSEVTREVRTFLATLSDGVNRLRAEGLVGAELDTGALDELETAGRAIWDALEGDGRRAPPSPMVYEDAGGHATLAVDPAHFGRAAEKLRELLTLMAPLTWERHEQERMRRFFDTRLQADRVPLLDFYEAYYREVVKPREEARKKRRRSRHRGAGPGEQSPAAETTTLATLSRDVLALVRSRVAEDPEASEVDLSRRDLEEAMGPVPPLPPDPRSVSLFVNWVPRSGHPDGGQVVVPGAQAHLGFGKYFSRFLYLLPDEVLAAVRDASRACDGVVLAEIAGDQAFNANLRPHIQETEILYPTGDRIGCPEALEVGALEVAPTPDGERLGLFVSGTDRRVIPLDLGFLNPHMRPPLYRLLRRFSPPVYTHLSLERNPVAGPDADEGGSDPAPPDTAGKPVVREPRITYEGAVVLRRESWTVATSAFPFREAGERLADFFLRLAAWRREHGIPERVYLACRPLAEVGARSQEEPIPAVDAHDQEPEPDTAQDEGAAEDELAPDRGNAPRGRAARPVWTKLRKPQYLDFRSPLVIQLLRRYRELDDRFLLVLRECLPRPVELPVAATGKRFVTESIVQLDLSTPTAEGPGVERPGERPHE